MLDLRDVAKNFETTVSRLRSRSASLDLGPFQTLFQQRRGLNVELEAMLAKRNSANDAMKRLAKEEPSALERVRLELRELGQAVKEKEALLAETEAQLEQLLLHLPNLPDPSVPVGADEAANALVRSWGEKPQFLFTPRQHFELGERLGMVDMERAAKVSGARFAFLKHELARLERALVSFMIDQHVAAGYTELLPPYLVNRQAMMGTGQLPKFEDDAFKTAGAQELFLIPTAEVPVTNYHQDEILEAEALPLKYVAFSPCFRAEAGAAGRDTRGLIRMHQFHKVEVVKFATPETSEAEHEALTRDACAVLERLGLHHRVMLLCTGDMGFSSQKTYDIEVWLPGANAYREISSCSNFGDFQARRAKIRYRPARGEKPRLLHTLNGSGLAVGRTLVAILENYQLEDGSVRIPEALRPYMNGLERLMPREALASASRS